MNKGVGPAVIRSLRVYVDGKPQSDWKSLAAKLGIDAGDYVQSTVNATVISGGERYVMAHFPQREVWERVRKELPRMQRRLCFCSTLDECWIVDQTLSKREEIYQPTDRCERNEAEEFND